MQKFSFVSAALITAALMALAGCGNALHELHQKDGPQHPAVTFDKAVDTLVQRGHFKFEAKTSGVYGNRAEDVTWEFEVVSGNAPGAKFNTDTGELSLQLSDTPGAVLAVSGSYTLEHRPADGEGYIPIGSYAEFQLIQTRLGSVNASDKYKQETDLDLLGDKNGNGAIGAGGPDDEYEEWASIKGANPSGVPDHRFHGTFDGDHKGIKNLYIDEAANYQGLFGALTTTGTIRNVKILSGKVSGGSYTGGVVGNSNGLVTNCDNWTAVSGGGNSTGGVVGSSGGSIIDCDNWAAVSGGGNSTGGVVGYTTGPVTNCSNSGTVTGRGALYAGGVVGYTTETVTNCSNTATATVTGITNVGGVVGYYNNITGCTNTGTVTGTGNNVGGVGGGTSATVSVTNCSNGGIVTGSGDNAGGVAGLSGGGGTVFVSCYNTGTVTASTNAGGVVEVSTGSITACYNTGTVLGTDIGGVVGKNDGVYAVVTDCYYKDNGVSGCGVNNNGGNIVSLTPFSGTAFTPSGTGWETVSNGGPWKDGTTNGGQLPKLWFE
jgi:hypothetical protein